MQCRSQGNQTTAILESHIHVPKSTVKESREICTLTSTGTHTYTHLLQWLDKISCLEVTSCCHFCYLCCY